MNAYDIFFDGIARIQADEPDTAREMLKEQLTECGALTVLDVGKATLVGSDR